ncbi:hypothetical protein KR52_09040 [Synechococcus sp. KORDI-52]|nr:hypothetical protein KR52_09040 [Synechococcus sp. KORDI-52]
MAVPTLVTALAASQLKHQLQRAITEAERLCWLGGLHQIDAS